MVFKMETDKYIWPAKALSVPPSQYRLVLHSAIRSVLYPSDLLAALDSVIVS